VERTLSNGLTVIAIRRSAIPLAEVRLRLPFAKANTARAAMLSQTLLSGTHRVSSVEIAAELQKVGGGLSSGADPDRLMVSGNSLVAGLDRLLEIMASVLTDAAYPGSEVSTERDRLANRIQAALSQPSHLAR
jgi:zinc protease